MIEIMFFNKKNQNALINRVKTDMITDQRKGETGMEVLFILILIIGTIIAYLIWIPFINGIGTISI